MSYVWGLQVLAIGQWHVAVLWKTLPFLPLVQLAGPGAAFQLTPAHPAMLLLEEG